MRYLCRAAAGAAVALSGTLFAGCPAAGAAKDLLNECFGEDSISRNEYHALSIFEQPLYVENDCERYEPRSDFLGDLLD